MQTIIFCILIIVREFMHTNWQRSEKFSKTYIATTLPVRAIYCKIYDASFSQFCWENGWCCDFFLRKYAMVFNVCSFYCCCACCFRLPHTYLWNFRIILQEYIAFFRCKGMCVFGYNVRKWIEIYCLWLRFHHIDRSFMSKRVTHMR